MQVASLTFSAGDLAGFPSEFLSKLLNTAARDILPALNGKIRTARSIKIIGLFCYRYKVVLWQFRTFVWAFTIVIVITVITSLFTKLLLPGNSKETFRFWNQAATCPPVHHTRWRLHSILFMLNVKQGAVNTNFISFRFEPTWNQTRVSCFSSRAFIHSTTDRFDVGLYLFFDCWSQFNYSNLPLVVNHGLTCFTVSCGWDLNKDSKLLAVQTLHCTVCESDFAHFR